MSDRQIHRSSYTPAGRGGRAFAVERRALPARAPRRGEVRRTPAQLRAVGVAAVRDALLPGALADDVARILAGRTTFPALFYGTCL